MASIYGEERAQRLPDDAWLRDAGAKDWIVLTKDDASAADPLNGMRWLKLACASSVSPARS